MLVAQIRRAGAEPVPLGVARDNREHLSERIHAGLDCEMLLLSGGVSAGKLDLVPSELAAAGVDEILHKVHVKPGKPIWFGCRRGRGDNAHPVWVFGLPGNPVSSMVCFELFVRTAIRRLMGIEPSRPQTIAARLAKEHIARGDRPTYHPSHLIRTDDGLRSTPVNWQGSADLRATVQANGMTMFPAGDATYGKDSTAEIVVWDGFL